MKILCVSLALLLAGCSHRPAQGLGIAHERAATDTNQWYQTPYGYLEELPRDLLYIDGSNNLVWVASTMHDSAVQSFSLLGSYDLRQWFTLVPLFVVTWGTNIVPWHVDFTNQAEFFRVGEF